MTPRRIGEATLSWFSEIGSFRVQTPLLTLPLLEPV
jgi:hypothetical protein